LNSTALRVFHKLCLSTLIAVYLLILVGGIVRTTGSGMGCPDWPRCFGQWVPPTSENDLPANYREAYSSYRDKKNQKFIRYLRTFGMDETADQLANDKSVLTETGFNPVKTWIEYLNRLTGAVIGLFIIALVVRSWPLRSTHRNIFVLSVLTLIGVIFQGWFGSIVVSTNLTSWTITIHMLLALVIVALLIYLYQRSKMEVLAMGYVRGMKAVLTGCIVLVFIQILLGTDVREAIDRIAMTGAERNLWIGMLGSEFIKHRAFSWMVLLAHAILMFQIGKTKGGKTLPRALFILILCTLLTGVGMAYFSIPAFLQPIHLLIATVTFGLQLMLLFRLTDSKNLVIE
jgi:cytochrome c oxidase assembly protein subunit 15